jgi:penicillin-binding protein 1A
MLPEGSRVRRESIMTTVRYDPPSPGMREAPSAPPPAAWRLPPRRLLRWAWPVLLALLLGAVGGVAVAAAIHMPKVDSLASFTPSLGTQLYDKGGHAFRAFAREHRVMLKPEEIPPLIQRAVLASEDSNFFRHGGVDAMGILRSALTDVRQGKIVQGASTITMQLARTVFLNRDRTWHRKIEEALTAVELEKTYSKQQILTLYLNLVNLGHGNYGVEAASRFYFNKPAKDLSLAEAATLVGIIPAPSRYSPYNTPEVVLKQRDRVLRRMLDERFIKPAEYQAATNQPLLVATQQPQDNFAAYFAEDVRKYLETTYGATSLYEGGLQVQTTLDPIIQDAAQRAVQSWLLKVDHRRGWRGPLAVLKTDDLDRQTLPTWTGTPVAERWYQGIVLASDKTAARVKIGKAVYTLGREGIAWTGKTSLAEVVKPGAVAWFRLGPPEVKEKDKKAAKEKEKEKAKEAAAGKGGKAAPLVLYLEQEPRMEAAAVVLESKTGAIRAMVGGWDFERNKFNRITQARRQVGSAFKPFVYGAAIEQGWTPADTLLDAPTSFIGGDGKLSYHPQNYYHKHYGIVTLRRALEQSINVPAVKLFELVGGKRVIDFAHRCGVQTPMPAYPSMALGAADLLPIEMAGAYAAIANQGTYIQPYLIDRIVTPDGQVLEQRFPATRTATSPPVAYVLTHMMEGVIEHGTGYELHTLDTDIAGKTGTTDDFSDAWFIGFTSRYTILTWIGYDVKKSLGQGMSGAVAALPMWKAIAEDGLAKGWIAKGEKLPVPPGVVMKDVEYYTGLLPGQGSDRTLKEAFVAGTEPNRQYNNRWQTITSLPWYQQRAFYIPKQGESMAPGTTGPEAGAPGEEGRPTAPKEGQVVGEGDAGTVVPPPG